MEAEVAMAVAMEVAKGEAMKNIAAIVTNLFRFLRFVDYASSLCNFSQFEE